MTATGEAVLSAVSHRPWPLASGNWAIKMSWGDLLFAHWPVPAQQLAPLLPEGLEVDTYDGSAWVGVVPFRMESVQLRGLPSLPGANLFAEANVRTYVRDRKTGHRGVYFFSLDANNPFAVIAARLWYRLPYFFARMRMTEESRIWHYHSHRLFARQPAVLDVSYRATGSPLNPSNPGTLAHFLSERYVLFTHSRRRLIRADIHHRMWTLQPAEAEFRQESLARAAKIVLPVLPPVLHFSHHLDVYAWPPRTVD